LDTQVLIIGAGPVGLTARTRSHHLISKQPLGADAVTKLTFQTDHALGADHTQLRPWALMLVVASAEEYIADMLVALRA
jgi:thioredoxin reductase